MKKRKRSSQAAMLILTIIFSISILNPVKAQEPPAEPPTTPPTEPPTTPPTELPLVLIAIGVAAAVAVVAGAVVFVRTRKK